MVKVLFVCLGNICRSPMAEAVFQHKVNEAGLSEQILVDSAGTSSYHEGENAHGGTLQILRKYSIPYGGRSRPLSHQDFYNFDYLLAMDKQNLRDMQRRKPEDSPAQLRLFLDFAADFDEQEVPDPYYNDRFDLVYNMVNNGAEGLLQHIREQHLR